MSSVPCGRCVMGKGLGGRGVGGWWRWMDGKKFKVEGGRGRKARIGIQVRPLGTFLLLPGGVATLPKTGRCECVSGRKWPWRVESPGRASSSLLTVVVVGSCVVDSWHRNSISIAIAASKDGSIPNARRPHTNHGPLRSSWGWPISGFYSAL